jgi:hypothetical protein
LAATSVSRQPPPRQLTSTNGAEEPLVPRLRPEGDLILVEVADGVTLDWVRARTTAPYQVEMEEAVATPSR